VIKMGEKLLCPNCGKEVDSDWKICPHCGFDLTTLQSEEPKDEVIDDNRVGHEYIGENNDKIYIPPPPKKKSHGKVIAAAAIIIVIIILIPLLMLAVPHITEGIQGTVEGKIRVIYHSVLGNNIKIFIDGEDKGEFPSDTWITFMVDPGSHTVRATTLSGAYLDEKTVYVGSGETVEVELSYYG
jgi:hypothetical protein